MRLSRTAWALIALNELRGLIVVAGALAAMAHSAHAANVKPIVICPATGIQCQLQSADTLWNGTNPFGLMVGSFTSGHVLEAGTAANQIVDGGAAPYTGCSGATAGAYTSANITVTAAGCITAAANGSGGGGGSGWTLIATTTISSQTTVNVLSVFSATYSEYDIELIQLVPSGTNSLTFQFGNASGPTWETSANYYWGQVDAINGGGTSYEPGGNSATSLSILPSWSSVTPPTRTGEASLFVRVPTSTNAKNLYGHVSFSTSTNMAAGSISGLLTTATSYDSFRLQCASAITSGIVKVYGR